MDDMSTDYYIVLGFLQLDDLQLRKDIIKELVEGGVIGFAPIFGDPNDAQSAFPTAEIQVVTLDHINAIES